MYRLYGRVGWRVLVVVVCVVSFLYTIVPAYAHFGGVAGDGCHYCRVNCDQYGVAYGERHCHPGRGSSSGTVDAVTSDEVVDVGPDEVVGEAMCTPTVAQHESWLRNLLSTNSGVYYLIGIIAQVAVERERQSD